MAYQNNLPYSKECCCFQTDGETAQNSQCDKSRELNKVIGSVLYIGSFEKKCVMIKELFHSEQLKQHMFKAGVYQWISISALYEHILMGNVGKLYKYYIKCDNQHQYKALIESDMVSTHKVLIYNNTMTHITSINN